MTWIIPDPLPLQNAPGWQRRFEYWLAQLGDLVPGGLSLDLIGADATFEAFENGVSAADYAVALLASRRRRRAGRRSSMPTRELA